MDGRARVLVVDDDPQLLRLLEQVLRTEHDVSCASDGAVALAGITAGLRYDAIVCDLGMPGMDGIELYEALGRVAPEQRECLLFLTGGTRNLAESDFVYELRERCLQKPFKVPELLAAVRVRVAASMAA